MKVRIVNQSRNALPEYKTDHSAGMDLRADLKEEIIIAPLERKLIPTGLYIELPEGFEAQIRPRSGLALKKGVTVLNTPGTIDADYRGEIGVIVMNASKYNITISPGERICQMVINRYEKVMLEEVEKLETTLRGDGGFGSTGSA